MATTDPPRVLHVSQPVDAGVADVVATAVADQRARGWAVALACPPGPLADRAARAGVDVHDWPARRSPGLATLAEVLRLRRIVAAFGPDVVHLHSAKAGLAGRLAVRGSRPTVFQPHAWSFQAVTGPLYRATLAWERLAARRWTDRLVCVSDDERAAGLASGVAAPTTVVPNGVDTDALRPADRAAARRELGLAAAPTVVCVGRIAVQKGQDLLLRSWEQVLRAVPDARLVLVGDGPMRDRWHTELPAGHDPSVTWLGHRDDPAAAYGAADVVVLPSRWEGMALVPLEAMACGRPVVGFDVAGLAATVADCGAVVPAGDVDALAAALVARLLDPDRAGAEAARARDRAVARFGRAQATNGLADVLLAAAGDRAATARAVTG